MNNTKTKTYEDYWTKLLTPFVGGIITEVVIDTNEDEFGEKFYGLRIVHKTKEGKIKCTILWFLSDEEGNGAGRFELQEVSEN